MRGERTAALLIVSLVCAAGAAHAESADPDRLRDVDRRTLTDTYAAGVFEPEYDPPAPGTYVLPVIRRVSDHPVVGADGTPTTLFDLTGDRIGVVAFVYLSCVEALGRPHIMRFGQEQFYKNQIYAGEPPAVARAR